MRSLLLRAGLPETARPSAEDLAHRLLGTPVGERPGGCDWHLETPDAGAGRHYRICLCPGLDPHARAFAIGSALVAWAVREGVCAPVDLETFEQLAAALAEPEAAPSHPRLRKAAARAVPYLRLVHAANG